MFTATVTMAIAVTIITPTTCKIKGWLYDLRRLATNKTIIIAFDNYCDGYDDVKVVMIPIMSMTTIILITIAMISTVTAAMTTFMTVTNTHDICSGCEHTYCDPYDNDQLL